MITQGTPRRTIVIGVGNPYRRDDGLGSVVVSLLRQRDLPGLHLAESAGELDALIELWTGADLAVLVDAIRTRPTSPGRIHRISGNHPAATRTSAATGGNGGGLGNAVALARRLDRMPRRLLMFAVEAGDLEFGIGLTPAVSAAADQIAAEIADLVRVEVR